MARPTMEDYLAALLDGERLDWTALERSLGPDSPELARLRSVAGLLDDFAGSRETPDAAREQGERWGHLRVFETIGSGTYGEVLRAFDPLLQQEVALKLRHPHVLQARVFISEARRLARVRHQNVLAVHGAAIHDGRAGLWSDLIVGQSLSEWVAQQGPRPLPEILAAGQALASALGAVHAAGLVHGDVKPGNIMREDAGGRVVLMDFGSAGERADAERHGLVGSPASMSPEQSRGEPIGPKSDLYGLGVVLYHLATGKVPRRANPDAAESEAAKPVAGNIQHLPGALRSLLADLLHSDPAARPDAAEAGRRLAGIVDAPRRRRKRLAVGAVIASLALGLVASIFALYRVDAERAKAVAARERSEAVTDFLIDSVGKIRAEELTGPASLMALFDVMAKTAEVRLAQYPRALAHVQVVIGRGIADLGDPVRAAEYTGQVLSLLEGDDPQTVYSRGATLMALATMRKDANQLQAAEDLARRAIATYETQPAGDKRALRIIKVRTLLGNLLTLSGRWREAVAAHRGNIEARAALLGAESPALAPDYNNLAVALQRLDRYEPAKTAFAEARLRLDMQHADRQTTHHLWIRHGIALCEMGLGNLDRAAEQLAKVRDAYRLRYPEGHEMLDRIEANMAEVERRAGRPQAALAMIENLPASTWETTGLRLVLVDVLSDAGQYQRALEAALPLKASMGEHDPRAPYVPALLAWLRWRSGQLAAPPATEIQTALATLQSEGYGDLREAGKLAKWQAELGE